MENTTSSTRGATRVFTLASPENSIGIYKANFPFSLTKLEDSKTRRGDVKQRQQDQSALIDITNDSPIVGLAMGISVETPSSVIDKLRSNNSTVKAKNVNSMTLNSGEVMLRGQVKTLLQKVAEQANTVSSNRPIRVKGFVNSPIGVNAPTPANTPQIDSNGSDSFSTLLVIDDQMEICQDVMELDKSLTRSLLLDFTTDSSDLNAKAATDDDSASIWSIQVNASANDEDYYDQEEGEEDEYGDEGEDDGDIYELFEGMRGVRGNDKFRGKHTRFVYDSGDEKILETRLVSFKDCEADEGPANA